MADEDTSREPHPGSAEAVGRYGERTAGGAASFRCAAYGEAVNAERWARIEAVLSAERPDSAALHAIDWELAPFCAASAGPAIAVTAGAAPSSLTAPLRLHRRRMPSRAPPDDR